MTVTPGAPVLCQDSTPAPTCGKVAPKEQLRDARVPGMAHCSLMKNVLLEFPAGGLCFLPVLQSGSRGLHQQAVREHAMCGHCQSVWSTSGSGRLPRQSVRVWLQLDGS